MIAPIDGGGSKPSASKTGVTRLGPNVWVVRRGRGYSITEEGSQRYLIPPLPQRVAVAIARLIARAYRSELIVQGEDGRIRTRDSHGHDPFPPRG